MTRSTTALASIAFIAVSACGGSSDGPTSNNSNNPAAGDGGVSATINGTAWRSTKSADRVNKSGNIYAIASVGLPYVLTLGLANVTGPTTLNLSLTATGFNGSSAIIANGSGGGWGTAFNGGSGTITVTTLTANHIVGTFSFDAVPGSGNATGTLQVRNGKFDLTF